MQNKEMYHNERFSNSLSLAHYFCTFMTVQFIEEAFQSRINESRHIQLMYDKFRRYRKREEDKMEVRMQEVRRAGNVDSLEGKLQERAGQLSAVQREVAQKEKVR